MICPRCRSVNCARSRRRGAFDFLGKLAGLRPWRCLTCDIRFHAGAVALSFERFAHCSRCGNFDLEVIPRDRVEMGAFVALKKFLGFPAYRCDPCRYRFFTLLPARAIFPSMVSARPAKIENAEKAS